MKRRKRWLLVCLATWLVSAICCGTGTQFFRVGCPDGESPENLTITLDKSGQISLEFDTVDQRTYVIDDVCIYDRALSESEIKALFTLRGNRPLPKSP